MSNTDFVTKDSGEREQHATGAVRDVRGGKGRFDLLPTRSIRRLAGVYERGALKYADRNWEKGMPLSRYMDSALRHTFQYLEGQRDEDHLAQAAFNLLAVIDHEERIQAGLLPAHLNDLPQLPNVSKPLDQTGSLSPSSVSSPSSP
jgi:hypothetical protein